MIHWIQSSDQISLLTLFRCLISLFFLFKKKNNRLAALIKSTSIPEEQKSNMAKYMKTEYMSSEESMSEDEPGRAHSGDESDASDLDDIPQRKKVLVCRPLPWRGQELDRMINVLDRKIMR